MAMEIRAAMESSEDLEKDIAASCDTLEEMMTAVSKELFVDSAANYVVGETCAWSCYI